MPSGGLGYRPGYVKNAFLFRKSASYQRPHPSAPCVRSHLPPTGGRLWCSTDARARKKDNTAMLVTIRPSPGGIGGVIAAPPSKSMARRAVRRAGCGALSHHPSGIQQGHLCHPVRCRAAVRRRGHRRRRCHCAGAWAFPAPDRPGGLLRKRQHPAVFDPHCQLDRPAGHLYRARTADGAPAIRIRNVIS